MKPAISAKMADYRPHLSKQGKHQGYCTVGQAAPSDSLTYWLSRFFSPYVPANVSHEWTWALAFATTIDAGAGPWLPYIPF